MKYKGTFFLYRLLLVFLLPAVLIYFLLRVAKNREYASTGWQRLGFLPSAFCQTGAGAVWFHAVSVGEVLAICRLMARLREELPGVTMFLSTSTLAGYSLARDKASPMVRGVFYAPIDYPFAIRRVLRMLRPNLLVVAETEIWPNLFREAKRTGCGVAIVNGRISDRAYPRYRRWRIAFRRVLEHVDRILVQDKIARDRYLALGVRGEITGNLKYDAALAPAQRDSPVRAFAAGARLLIAASTASDGALDEEDAVLDAFLGMSGWKLILAPRDPERFDQVARKIERTGLRFVRRSQMPPSGDATVLLLDTMGELAGLFDLADAVFMGGTLARRGGHNILEPAGFGKPIVLGPHMENFREIASEFHDGKAFRQIADAASLRDAILRAASDPTLGERARICAQARRGAVERSVKALGALYRSLWSCRRAPQPVHWLLYPWSRLWRVASLSKIRRDRGRARRLTTPVVSIGNITAGGTGKTPMVLHMARRLRESGLQPGVLTRGYGRQSPHKVLTLAAGANFLPAHTGDEAQMLLRSGLAALGIGSDRFAVGRMLEERFHPDILLLDDGFQHVRLARDFDVLLIDAMNPFGYRELIPLGRLREPLSAIARASAIVITRVQNAPAADAIEAVVRRYNSNAPVFRSRILNREWVDFASGERYPAEEPLPFERTLAFCGLGNPQSFWTTLQACGIRPLDRFEYGDHHSYTPRELRRFGQLGQSRQAGAILTTEKDVMNLCEEAEQLLAPLRLLWLRIETAIENEGRFLEIVRATLENRGRLLEPLEHDGC